MHSNTQNDKENQFKKVSIIQSVGQPNIYEHFFHHSRDLVCIAGLDGFFKIISPSFMETLGYNEEELLSKPFAEFVHPEDRKKTDNEVKLMLDEGLTTIRFENRYFKKDGDIVYLQWNSTVNIEDGLIYAIARDITEQKHMEQKLERSEKLLNAAQSIAKLGSWSFNVKTYDLFWSDELYKIFGIESSSPNLYEQYLSRFDEIGSSKLNEAVELAINSQKSYQFEHTVNLPDGTVKFVKCSGIPVLDENGETFKIEGVVQDITETNKSSKELEKSERLLDETQSISKTGSWSMDFASGELYWSRETYKIYEIDPSLKGIELTKIFFSRFTDKERDDLDKAVNEALVNGKPYTIDRFVQFPSGTKKWIRGTGQPITGKNGKITKIEGIAQDVTESKIAELTILENIRDKETLLKELHHRVKNNLQVISSMLNLQSSMIENEEVKSIFQDSQQRIKSMASLHDLLYNSTDLSEINFSEYIVNLINDAIISYRGKDNGIHLEFDLSDNLLFQLELAVPLGLFVNEIITNSLKHGVKDRPKPVISISIKEGGKKNYILRLSDNGMGFNIDNLKNDTLGLLLIDSLASQLDGNLNRTSDENGTQYELIF